MYENLFPKKKKKKKRKLRKLEKLQASLEATLTYLWIRQIQNELRMEREAKRLCRKRKANYVV